MGVVVVTPPALEPVTLAEMRAFLRVTTYDEDELIRSIIAAARSSIETELNRALITQTLRYTSRYFGAYGFILPRSPLQSLVSFEYINAAGATIVLPGSYYEVDLTEDPGRVVIAYDSSWPDTRLGLNVVRVTYKAGYGDTPDTVPPEIRHAIKMRCGSFYENRSDEIIGQTVAQVNKSSQYLIAPYRRLEV